MVFLTAAEVMVLLGIKDPRTLARYRKLGLDYVKMGRAYRYTKEMIEDFIKKNSSTFIKENTQNLLKKKKNNI